MSVIQNTFITAAAHTSNAQKATAKKAAQQQPVIAQPAAKAQPSVSTTFSLNLYRQLPQQQPQQVVLQQQQQLVQQQSQQADVKDKLAKFTGVSFAQVASQAKGAEGSKSIKTNSRQQAQRPAARQQANPFFLGLDSISDS